MSRPLSECREVRVHPSLSGKVRKFGKFGEVCFSCGTCTLGCDLSTDSAPFPRRPVQYAVLGLKEPLLESLEPWLCQDCGDCSTNCPQKAEPKESMATLEGGPGHFTATLKKRSRFIDEAKCTGCGTCVANCPTHQRVQPLQPAVVDYIEKNAKVPSHVCILDVGTGVRSLLFTLVISPVRTKRLLVLDAIDAGRAPGELFEIDPSDIPPIKLDDFSMHQVPTSNMLVELKDRCGVEVRVLACQTGPLPEEVRPGLSDPVARAVPKAAARITKGYFGETTGEGEG